MALQHDVWQGEYGERLIHALSAAAGLTTSKKSLDVDGVDLSIHLPSPRAIGVGFPAIEAQVKTCRNPTYVSNGDEISYPMEVAHFNHLSGVPYVDFPLPRLLFLVVVPQSTEEYVSVENPNYIFRHNAYWCNIMSEGQISDGQGRHNVRVPTRNLLTVPSLIERVGDSYGGSEGS